MPALLKVPRRASRDAIARPELQEMSPMNPAAEYAPTPARLDWWLNSRFGVSYHWGLYSIGARGEWVRSIEQMSLADY